MALGTFHPENLYWSSSRIVENLPEKNLRFLVPLGNQFLFGGNEWFKMRCLNWNGTMLMEKECVLDENPWKTKGFLVEPLGQVMDKNPWNIKRFIVQPPEVYSR